MRRLPGSLRSEIGDEQVRRPLLLKADIGAGQSFVRLEDVLDFLLDHAFLLHCP